MSDRRLVFFSYRHDSDGQRWLTALRGALEPYVLAQDLITWSDHDIRVGTRWHSQIVGAIESTRVAVLLVNQGFFASKYIREHELPRLLADADAGRLTIVVVPIGECDPTLLQQHGLAERQFALEPEKPLSARVRNQREKAIVETAMKIRDVYGTIAEPVLTTGQEVLFRRGESVAGSEEITSLRGLLIDVPSLNAARHVPRDAELALLREQLLRSDELAVGLTSAVPGLGLQGMGGMGKSVMAQALCHDDAVRRAFPDGIAWVALGQRPELLTLQNQLLHRFDPVAPPSESVSEARSRLEAAFAGKRALLVIDDIWDAEHFRAFDVVRGRSRLLLTTRDASVLAQIGARAQPIERMPDAVARALLAQRAGMAPDALPPEADAVLRETDGLPLAIALAGAQVADGVSWGTLIEELRRGHVDFLDHRYGSVFATLGRSVDALPGDERERYLELAVFPEDTEVSTSVIARLWSHSGGLSAAKTEQLLARLERKALLTLIGDARSGRVTLHDLQRDFVRMRTPDIGRLHSLLLDAYRATLALREGATDWAMLPDDEPYLGRYLTDHLAGAERFDELRSTLLDLDWIDSRLRAETRMIEGRPQVDMHAVVQAYAALPGDAATSDLARALRLSTHILHAHPEALAQQLFGRLGTSGDAVLKSLAEKAWARVEALEHWTPMVAALSPVGAQLGVMPHGAPVEGALLLPDGRRALSWARDDTLRLWDLEKGSQVQVLAGHKSSVEGALLLPDGRRALSWSDDRTLRLWDLEKGSQAQVLDGHEGWIFGALLLPDGRRALSWSDDRTLRLWDLEQGSQARVVAGHESSVEGALLLPDGQRALSWSKDGTLRLWDPEKGGQVQVLAGHETPVEGALLLSDGQRALSWSADSTLRLWDLEKGSQAQVLAGHKSSVEGALLLPDGRRALSWSDDRTLRLWDLEKGSQAQVLDGHEGWIFGALLLPDGQRALSWSKDGTLRLWDLEQGIHVLVLDGHEGWIFGALLLPDGQRALSWSKDGTLRLWDLEQGSRAQVLAGHEASVGGALLLPDGRRALSWSDDRTLRLWDLEQGSQAQVLAGHEGRVRGALLLPDGRRALSWSDDRTLLLWDMEQGSQAQVLAGHEDEIEGALLLPDGRRALSWSVDSALRLWDLEQGGQARVLDGHEGRVRGALLLPDGRRALSWARDDTLRLWDLTAAAPVACYWADAVITTVALAQQVDRIFAGDALGRVQILNLKPEEGSRSVR